MKHIKKFNENILQGDFDTGKKEVLELIDKLYETYEDWVDDVSPKHWRTTGSHFTDLRKMKDNIDNFTCITDDEREIEWVKKIRKGDID